jgi:hypothetical protein
MSPAGHHQPTQPKSVNGFHVGDRVVTPLGRIATITGFRVDGYVDAEYEGRHPTLSAVILQPHTLKRAH